MLYILFKSLVRPSGLDPIKLACNQARFQSKKVGGGLKPA